MRSVINACCRLKRYERPLGLHLNEASALCLRAKAELLAVGDKDFMVTTAAVGDDRLGNEHSRWLRDILRDEVRDGKSGSQREAIATDGSGRVFIVKESSLSVVVLSRSLAKHVHTIELDVTDGPDEDALQLLEDDNAGPEAILLLEAGRLLTVKQKDPALLIESAYPTRGQSHLSRALTSVDNITSSSPRVHMPGRSHSGRGSCVMRTTRTSRASTTSLAIETRHTRSRHIPGAFLNCRSGPRTPSHWLPGAAGILRTRWSFPRTAWPRV